MRYIARLIKKIGYLCFVGVIGYHSLDIQYTSFSAQGLSPALFCEIQPYNFQIGDLSQQCDTEKAEFLKQKMNQKKVILFIPSSLFTATNMEYFFSQNQEYDKQHVVVVTVGGVFQGDLTLQRIDRIHCSSLMEVKMLFSFENKTFAEWRFYNASMLPNSRMEKDLILYSGSLGFLQEQGYIKTFSETAPPLNQYLTWDQIDQLPAGGEVITGASGFLAGYVAEELVSQKKGPVILLTRQSEPSFLVKQFPQKGYYIVTMPSVDTLIHDGRARSGMESLIAKSEIVYHLAAMRRLSKSQALRTSLEKQTFYQAAFAELKDFFYSHVLFTELLAYYVRYYRKRLVFVSSTLSYAYNANLDKPPKIVGEEDEPLFTKLYPKGERPLYLAHAGSGIAALFAEAVDPTHNIIDPDYISAYGLIYAREFFGQDKCKDLAQYAEECIRKSLDVVEHTDELYVLYKLFAELLIRGWTRKIEPPILSIPGTGHGVGIVCRVPNLYDPKQPLQTGLVRDTLLHGFLKTPFSFSPGSRHWVEIHDIAKALIVAGHKEYGEKSLRTFHLGSQQPAHSTETIVGNVLTYVGLDRITQTQIKSTGQNKPLFMPTLSVTRAGKELNYETSPFVIGGNLGELVNTELKAIYQKIFRMFIENEGLLITFLDYYEQFIGIMKGLLVFPYGLEFQVSELCNARCWHCPGNTIFKDRPPGKIMDEQTLLSIMKQLSAFVTDREEHPEKYADFQWAKLPLWSSFSGSIGEPTRCAALWKALRIIAQNPWMEAGLFTNALELSSELIEALVTLPGMRYVHLSVDCASADMLRQLKGVCAAKFTKMCKGIQLLMERVKETRSSLNVVMGMVIGTENWQEIYAFAEFARSLGVKTIRYKIDLTEDKIPERSFVKDCRNPNERELERQRIMGEIFTQLEKVKTDFTSKEPGQEFRVSIVHDKKRQDAPHRSYTTACRVSSLFMTVVPNGDVRECDHPEAGRNVLGNLTRQSLDQVIKGPNFRKNEIRPDETCIVCPPLAQAENELLDFLVLVYRFACAHGWGSEMEIFLRAFYETEMQKGKRSEALYPLKKLTIEADIQLRKAKIQQMFA